MHGRGIDWTWSWVAEGEGMAPHVSPLTQAFLSATGRHISPSILWECWPPKHDIVPRQPMSEIRARITRCLDQVATRSPSNIAWDIFAWPDANKDRWGEDCLPYSPGSTVDLSLWMPGIQLVLHDETGKYQGVARVLKYEGHMLVYDPQTNGRVGSNEGYTFFTHWGRVVVSERPGQLLSHPLHSASRPNTPWGTTSQIHTDWSPAI